MTKRLSIGLAGAAAIAVAVAGWSWGGLGGRFGNAAPVVRYTRPVQREVAIELADNGILAAESAIHIAAPNVNNDRKLIELVPEGTVAKKGDVLAKFDTAELEDQLESLEDSGLEAKLQDTQMDFEIRLADLAAAHQTTIENAKLAELTFQTMKYAAKLDRDAAEARMNNARNEIKVAENRIKQERNRRDVQVRQVEELIEVNARKIAETKQAIGDFTVKAPADGIVVYPEIKIGGLTRKPQTGDQLYKAQIFLILPNLFKMTAELEIAEEDIRRVAVGEEAEIVLEAFRDTVFTGEVYRIDPLAHIKENNEFIKVFTVGVRIKERDLERLRPGMNARVTIKVKRFANAWTLPVEALFAEGEDYYVFAEAGPALVRRAVEVVDANQAVAVLGEPPPGRVAIPDRTVRELAAAAAPLAGVRWVEYAP